MRKYSAFAYLVLVCLMVALEHAFNCKWVTLLLLLFTGIIGLAMWWQIVRLYYRNPFKFDLFITEIRGSKIISIAALVIAVPIIFAMLISICNFIPGIADTKPNDLVQISPTSYVMEPGSPQTADKPLAITPVADGNSGNELDSDDLLWPVIYHFTGAGNQHLAVTKSARGWAFVISMLGIVLLGGILITTLVNWVDQRAKNFETGRRCYPDRQFRNRKTTIFIGSHPIILSTIQNIIFARDDRPDYVLILTSQSVPKLRTKLHAVLPQDIYERIILYSGDMTDYDCIDKLPLFASDEIYVAGENNDPSHDVRTMECLEYLTKSIYPDPEALTKEQKEAMPIIKAHTLFENQGTFSILQASDKPAVTYGIALFPQKAIEVIPYNYLSLWAQKVILGDSVAETVVVKGQKKERVIAYDPICNPKDPDKPVHLVVVGMSKMGIALATEMAFLTHLHTFSNGQDAESRRLRTRITFISKDAKEEMKFFTGRYKALFQLSRWRMFDLSDTPKQSPDNPGLPAGKKIDENASWHAFINDEGNAYNHLLRDNEGRLCESDFMDIEWQFIHGGIEEEAVQSYLSQQVELANLNIAMCMNDSGKATAAALYLPDDVLRNANVLVYQRDGSQLLSKLSGKVKNIKPFGMLGLCPIDLPVLNLAKYVAMMYNIYAELVKRGPDKDKDKEGAKAYDLIKTELNQKTAKEIDKKWNELKMWERWSNIYNALNIIVKLRSLGLNLDMEENALVEKLGVNKITLTANGGTDSIYAFVIDKDAPYYKLAIAEHNRWNMEKLLTGFLPISKEQNDNLQSGKTTKEDLKSNGYHPNICSFEHLDAIDPLIDNVDIAYIIAIPIINEILKNRPQTKK